MGVICSQLEPKMFSFSMNMVACLATLGLVMVPLSVDASYANHQVEVPKCRTEYDTETSYEERCSTSFEQECDTINEEVCTPRVETLCDTVDLQECTTSYDRQCSTTYEQQCSTSYDQQCSTVYERE